MLTKHGRGINTTLVNGRHLEVASCRWDDKTDAGYAKGTVEVDEGADYRDFKIENSKTWKVY